MVDNCPYTKSVVMLTNSLRLVQYEVLQSLNDATQDTKIGGYT